MLKLFLGIKHDSFHAIFHLIHISVSDLHKKIGPRSGSIDSQAEIRETGPDGNLCQSTNESHLLRAR